MIKRSSVCDKSVLICVLTALLALFSCDAVEELVGAGSSNTEKRTVTGSTTMTKTNKTWQLITPAAEKEIHATLNAQWRWQNEQRAVQSGGGVGFSTAADSSQTGQDPMNAGIGFDVEFGTNFGYFPAPAPTSFVENGIRYWRVEISEGAKNSNLESENYRITVTSDIPGNHPANWNNVRVEASIEYAPYSK